MFKLTSNCHIASSIGMINQYIIQNVNLIILPLNVIHPFLNDEIVATNTISMTSTKIFSCISNYNFLMQ